MGLKTVLCGTHYMLSQFKYYLHFAIIFNIFLPCKNITIFIYWCFCCKAVSHNYFLKHSAFKTLFRLPSQNMIMALLEICFEHDFNLYNKCNTYTYIKVTHYLSHYLYTLEERKCFTILFF